MNGKQDDSQDLDPRLTALYSSGTDHRRVYEQWAQNYDTELIDDLGYVADREACAVFASVVTDRGARILEAGCGTGLAGKRLAAMDYSDIHGVDFSEEMLAIADSRNVYASLAAHDLTRPLPDAPPYDAALCVGVFAFGPLRSGHIHHVVDVVKPGAPAIVTVNGKAWAKMNWQDAIDGAARDYDFTIDNIVTIPYLVKQNIDGRVLVLRRPM
ncbi:MAG: class I SAM-dependent methyltransferase [Gammaproteobacteria bacterium]|nr:class I SAM-dependent methyltransferase [Gammaproteobacteria bacterium]MDH3468093.1 class I SAM-dependent methyltransferase [Gammaproteobacteria bacterium]